MGQSLDYFDHRYISFLPLRALDLEDVAKVNDPSRIFQKEEYFLMRNIRDELSISP
jgi:hypothetical protein